MVETPCNSHSTRGESGGVTHVAAEGLPELPIQRAGGCKSRSGFQETYQREAGEGAGASCKMRSINMCARLVLWCECNITSM